MDNRVSLVKCENYGEEVFSAVKKAVDLLGGIETFVKKGSVVILKVNAVQKAVPDKCATTHPAVVEAVGKLCKLAGAGRVIIVDSAGGPFNAGYMGGIFKACGYTEIAERCGFEENSNFDTFEAVLPGGKVSKKFLICDILQKADVIINVTKLKTHSFTGLSNAVKNMFGAIPGLVKVEMHGKYRTLDVFNNFLYDIQDYFCDKLTLHITDAVVGMEGPGPTSGTPRHIGAIFAGTNPTAVDVVGAKLMKADPLALPTVTVGIERGYINKDIEVEVLGEKVEDLAVENYKTVTPDGYRPFARSMPKWLQPVVHKLTTQRPTVNRRKCRGCKKCYEHCPVKAISMTPTKKGGVPKAKFDYNKCIRCYCCQELCPFGLIKVKSGLVYKLMHIGSNKKTKK